MNEDWLIAWLVSASCEPVCVCVCVYVVVEPVCVCMYVVVEPVCVYVSHARTVVRECCKGDDESQWERVKFDPPPPKNPLTDGHQNLRT